MNNHLQEKLATYVVCMYVCVCDIYIYIYRERERERERDLLKNISITKLIYEHPPPPHKKKKKSINQSINEQ